MILRWSHTRCKWKIAIAIAFCWTAVATLVTDEDNDRRCTSGFQQYTDGISNSSQKICARVLQLTSSANKTVFPEMTWNKAEAACKKMFSFLIDTDSRFYNTSIMQVELTGLGLELAWIGIRKASGFYTWQTSNRRLFHTMVDWGNDWQNDEEPVDDCVAMNVSSGLLMTFPCDSIQLPVVCMNNGFPIKPLKSLICEDDWHFSYQLDHSSERCIKVFPPRVFEISEAQCVTAGGQLVTEEDYHNLYHVLEANYLGNVTSEAYWIYETSVKAFNESNNNQTAECKLQAIMAAPFQMEWGIFNCSAELPLICKRPIIRDLEIKSKIHPAEVPSFPSTDLNYRELTCYATLGNSHTHVQDPLLTYQWYKNGVPVSNSYVIHPGSVYDESKEIGDFVSRQGTFWCEIAIRGTQTTSLSQEVDVFFSDVSSFILTIRGSTIPYNISQDFSRPTFELTVNLFRKPMISLRNAAQQLFPLATLYWDFQNISFNEFETTVSLLLFLNWTSELGNRPMREKKEVYDPLFRLLESYSYLFDDWGSTTIALQSADVCFTKNQKVFTNSNVTRVVSWPETLQTTSVTSNPICRTGLYLQTRTCKGSIISGAHWESFNYSACTEYETSIPDFTNPCPGGFEYVNGHLCIQYHSYEQTWEEAMKMCDARFSYMADGSEMRAYFKSRSSSKNFENNVEMWIAYRFSNGIYQPLGMSSHLLSEFKTLTFENRPSKPNSECVSLLHKNNKKQTVIINRNCADSLPFACVLKPITLTSVSVCPKHWIGSLYHGRCYFISSQSFDWQKAVDSCMDTQAEANILELHDRQSYFVLKSFLRGNTSRRKSSKWWMGLRKSEDRYVWLKDNSQTEFVDWHKDTNFQNGTSSGVMLYDASVKDRSAVKWSLDNVYNKNRYICEVPMATKYRTAYIRIITTAHSFQMYQNSTIVLPNLYCHISGDFVPNSIVWFKDGFPVHNQNDNLFTWNSKVLDFGNVADLQGYYACSVFQIEPFRRLFSEKFLYIGEVPDIKTFVVILYSKYNFENECINYSLGNYMDHTPIFVQELSTHLNISHDSHLALRNISCQSSTTKILLHLHILTAPAEGKHYRDNEDENKYLLKISDHLKDAVNPALDNWFKIYQVQRNNITVKSSTTCYEQKTFCGYKNITWPETAITTVAVPKELCVSDTGEAVYRQCLGDYYIGATWGPIKGECSNSPSKLTVSLHNLSNEVITKQNVLNVSYSLSHLTTAYEKIKSADVYYIAKTLSNVAMDPTNEHDVIRFAAKSVNNVLDVDPSILGLSQFYLNTSSWMIESLERIAFTMDIQNQSYQLTMDNIGVNVIPLQAIQTTEIPVGTAATKTESYQNWNVTTLFNSSTLPLYGIEVGIMLPTNLVIKEYLSNSGSESQRLSFIIYRKPHLFQHESKVTVVSSVIHAFVGEKYFIDLDPQVQMVFDVKNVSFESIEQMSCAFWDQRLNENMGSWSNEGCSSIVYVNGSLTCQCDHLTNFAVIVTQHSENSISRSHKVSLSIITYVGCCLSIFGLGMTILTYVIFRKWRRGNKHQTLCNLSVALLCVLLIFLFGIDKKESLYGCLVVAILLHYFMLSSFAWMLVEAVIQYLNFVKVYGSYIPRFMQKAMLFAWGMPLVIVAIILAIDYELYIGEQKYCWLSNKAFYYAFALPVLMMLVINLAIFILILYSITCGRDTTLRSNQSEKKQALACVRAAFCIFVLLGLSWLFGFMAIDGAQLVFHYLFAITTTLQGFFIFLLFVVQERTARELWQNLIFPYTISIKSHNTSHSTDMSTSHATQSRLK